MDILNQIFEDYETNSIEEILSIANRGISENDEEYLSIDDIIAMYEHAENLGDQHDYNS